VRVDILDALIKQSPLAGALVFVIWMVFRHLRSVAEVQKATADSCHAAHEQSVERMEKLQDRTNATIEKCTESFGENTTVLGQVGRALDRLNGSR
jgi:hypothetical protein